jgi:Uma2 family endonuclease
MNSAEELAERRMTVAEFLDHDDGTLTRYELVNGTLVAMNPPTTRHVQICQNLGFALHRQLRPPCRAYWANGGVAIDETGDTWRQPDVVVTCVAPYRSFYREPRLVAEILSPSTEKEDRTTKLDFYESVPSIEVILLVWQDTRRVRLRSRGPDGWRDQDVIGSGPLRIESLDVELTLEEIYADPWGEAE